MLQMFSMANPFRVRMTLLYKREKKNINDDAEEVQGSVEAV